MRWHGLQESNPFLPLWRRCGHHDLTHIKWLLIFRTSRWKLLEPTWRIGRDLNTHRISPRPLSRRFRYHYGTYPFTSFIPVCQLLRRLLRGEVFRTSWRKTGGSNPDSNCLLDGFPIRCATITPAFHCSSSCRHSSPAFNH